MIRYSRAALLLCLCLLIVNFSPKQVNAISNTIKAADVPHIRPSDLPTTQQAKLRPNPDGTHSDWFGGSVALSSDGNTALVSAVWDDIVPGEDNGSAYVFVRSGINWSRQAKLQASDSASNDNFGESVALSADGNTAYIGAPNADTNPTVDSGAVYIFTRSGTTWTQQDRISVADRANWDYFGISVSLSTDNSTLVVGAYGEDTSPTTNNGALYVFTRSGSTWVQQAKILPPTAEASGYFGQSIDVSTDGNMIVVGQTSDSVSPHAQNGAVYVFARAGGVWSFQSKITLAVLTDFDHFGDSPSLSADANTLLVGASGVDDGIEDGGAAYVFTRSGSVWTQQSKLLVSGRSPFEYSAETVVLSSDGNMALVGSTAEDSSGKTDNGAVYMFTRSGSTWTQQNILFAADPKNFVGFGAALALSTDGETALIGAPFDDPTAAYIFAPFSNLPTATPTSTPEGTPTSTNTPVPPRPDTVGVYKDGLWYLRLVNAPGEPDINVAFGGDPSDLPVAGDWNGDGMDTIGLYRSGEGVFYLSDSNTTPTLTYNFAFGNPGDSPFAGRWAVSPVHDGVGVYRNSNGILYEKKDVTGGFSDFFAVFGNPGDQGIAGDWDGNGFDSIGIYRSSETAWYFTNNSQPGGITFSTLSSDWGIGAGIPVVGDWNGDGTTTIGYLSPSVVFVLHSSLLSSGSDLTFAFGPPGSRPVAGKWTMPSQPPLGSVVNANPSNSANAGEGGAD